jgi:hypothetical protein
MWVIKMMNADNVVGDKQVGYSHSACFFSNHMQVNTCSTFLSQDVLETLLMCCCHSHEDAYVGNTGLSSDI